MFYLYFLGTTVTATGLFKTIPVRRQFYNTNKKKKEEIKKIEDLLIAFSIILPKVRFTLNHDKERIFQKNGCPDVRTAMLSILGRNVLNCLVQKTVQLEDLKVIPYYYNIPLWFMNHSILIIQYFSLAINHWNHVQVSIMLKRSMIIKLKTFQLCCCLPFNNLLINWKSAATVCDKLNFSPLG